MKPKRNPFDIYTLPYLRKKKKSEYDIYPNFNKRMIAVTLDSILLMLLTPVFDWIAPINRNSLRDIAIPANDSPSHVSSIIQQVLSNEAFVQSWSHNFALQIITYLLYSGICWYLWSATPGKMIMQMKIVQAKTHQRITMVNILLRLCGYIISSSFLLLGIFWIGMNKRHRGWHDYLGDTEVISVPFTWPKAWPKVWPKVWYGKNPANPPQPEESTPHETTAD